MKKIILLFLLIATSAFCQGSLDFKYRTIECVKMADFLVKRKHAETPEDGYAYWKLKALEKALITTEDDKKDFKKLFVKEFPKFREASERYKKENTLNNKLELIKLLIANEDSFRKLLTEKQLVYYKSYNPNEKYISDEAFKNYFMTEQVYNSYKKETF